MLLAIRAGLMSRSEAVSSFGYDAEDMDREIAADNARADAMGLIFDSDPRVTQKTGAMQVSTGALTGEQSAGGAAVGGP